MFTWCCVRGAASLCDVTSALLAASNLDNLGLRVACVNDVGVNRPGVLLQRDALDYSLHRVVRGRLVGTDLVAAVADGDGL
ncbi:hypothetical protein MTO96_030280 [Rhipicephalus appendiculatus]